MTVTELPRLSGRADGIVARIPRPSWDGVALLLFLLATALVLITFQDYGVTWDEDAHNWYGIPPTSILHTVGQFLISWDIVIFMLFLVSLRIPLLFSLILGAGVVGVTLITVGVLGSSSGAQRAGGVFVLVFAALGYYGYLGTAIVSVGGKPLPFGRPALSLFGGK